VIDADIASQPEVVIDADTASQPEVVIDADTASQPEVVIDAATASQPEVVIDAATASQPEGVVDAAYLRTVLPESAFAYLRFPNVWGLLGAPSGNAFDKLLRTEAHVKAILGIRSGVLEHFMPSVPADWRDLATFLLAETRSPLELAILAPQKIPTSGPSMPELLFTVSLNQTDPAAVNIVLQSLLAKIPGVELLAPLQADGNGQISAFGMLIEIYFDAAQRRLFLGLALSESRPLAQRIAALTATPEHAMRKIEKGIDESGQGLLLWLNPSAMLQAAESLGKFDQVAMLRATGLAEAQAIAFGMGGSGGKQRIKILLDMPQVGLRSLLPGLHSDVPFMAANGLDTVLMLGLPTAKDISLLETRMRPMLSSADYRSYKAGKAELEKALGLTVEQLTATFGGELLALHDQAGYYLALGVRNQDNYKILLDNLVRNFGLKHETRELLGATFHHVKVQLPSEFGESITGTSAETNGSDGMPGLALSFINQPTHLYWVEQPGYLLLADVPQVLMDNLQATQKESVASWLRTQQGVDPAGALLLGSIRSKGVPQFLYQIHLWLLSYLGDITNHPVDLFSLPSTHDLNLPDAGAYSLQFTSSPSQIAVELVYESDPLDILLNIGGIPTLALMGATAAIAIPAYMATESHCEPEPRLKEFSPDIKYSIMAIRDYLDEFYTVMERYPGANEIDICLADFPTIDNAQVRLTPDTGVITIQFSEASGHAGDLILTPTASGPDTNWTCGGSLATAAPAGVCQQ
jgi:hypothetical protein